MSPYNRLCHLLPSAARQYTSSDPPELVTILPAALERKLKSFPNNDGGTVDKDESDDWPNTRISKSPCAWKAR